MSRPDQTHKGRLGLFSLCNIQNTKDFFLILSFFSHSELNALLLLQVPGTGYEIEMCTNSASSGIISVSNVLILILYRCTSTHMCTPST